MDCSLPGSSVHGIFQARILEWVDIAFSSHEQGPAQTSKDELWPHLPSGLQSLCPVFLSGGGVCAQPHCRRVWSVLPLHQRAWSAPSPPEDVVYAWPLHQEVRTMPPLHQRAWSVPDLSSRGRDLSLNSPAGVMSCTWPLCQRCGLYPPVCQRTWPWASGAAGPPLTVRLAVVLRWGRG